MEWERWTVKSRRKKVSVDDGIRYTIKNREQNRHYLENPMSATEVRIRHYTMDGAKFILDKMAIPSSA
jgi:macrodomain Ter protein organizer (MatP/YcbG family)